jgi:hypothetical protein
MILPYPNLGVSSQPPNSELAGLCWACLRSSAVQAWRSPSPRLDGQRPASGMTAMLMNRCRSGRRGPNRRVGETCHLPALLKTVCDQSGGLKAVMGATRPSKRSISIRVSCPIQPWASRDVPASRVSTFGLPWADNVMTCC